MAIEHGMWRIGNTPFKLQPVKIENENLLEELITKDISILNDGWLLIGYEGYPKPESCPRNRRRGAG